MTAAVAPLRASQNVTLVDSNILGTLTVTGSSIIEFSRGILGFPAYQRFALVAVSGRQGLYWLQSLDDASLTFVLIDPFVATDDYSIDIPDITAAELRARTPEEIVILAIVTLPDCPHASFTANLRGPLAINPLTRMAVQLVLADAPYDTRVPVELSRCR